MENQESYNGWSNWDTWNAALWLSNDEYYYHTCVRIVERSTNPARDLEEFTVESGLKGDDFDPDKVDWDEVAASFADE